MKKSSSPTSVEPVKTVNDTLANRGTVYGDFSLGISTEATIMKALSINHERNHGQPLPEEFYLMLSKIVMKITRLSVSPLHLDSIHDVQGYGKLYEDYIHKLIGTQGEH